MNKEHIGSNFDDFLKKEDFKDITSTFDDLVKWQNEEIQRLKAENEELKRKNTILEFVTEPQRQEIEKYQDKALKLKQALEEIQNVLFPKNKLLITDCEGLLKTQEILNEVLEDV